MKKFILFPLIIFIASCADENTNTEINTVDKDKTYNWRLVTSWPKNYPGLGMAPERICLLYTSPSPRD